MSTSRDDAARKLLEAVGAGPATRILCHLPEELWTVDVLKALICAEYAGYLRHAREAGSAELATIRLSSSRTQ